MNGGSTWARGGRYWMRHLLVGVLVVLTGGQVAYGPVVQAQTATDQPVFAPSEPVSYAPGETRSVAVKQAACRPATPAVEPIPGTSVAIDHGPAECNTVALTFDAGADRGYAEAILDILRQYDVPASFGMTGVWADQNSDLVRRMGEEGHQLINHTWSHRSFTGFSPGTRPLAVGERRLELDRTDELLKGLTERSTRPYFRPPYGDLNPGVLKDVSDAGYDYTIMWTVDSLGWNHLPAASIVSRCLGRAEAGAIYIFHVGAESQDAQALGAIVEGLGERGLGFVTVSDLLGL